MSDEVEGRLVPFTEFEWDEVKRAANLSKHGLDFEDVRRAFNAFTVRTPARNSGGEPRWSAVGVLDGREIAVIYVLRSASARLISARRASKRERESYRKAIAVGPPPGQN